MDGLLWTEGLKTALNLVLKLTLIFENSFVASISAARGVRLLLQYEATISLSCNIKQLTFLVQDMLCACRKTRLLISGYLFSSFA